MLTASMKRIILKISTKRKIYFLAENPYSASTTVRGHVIRDQFLQDGVYSFVFDLEYELKTGFAKLKKIKNSYIIIIKRAFKNEGNLLEILKANGNTLIWDPLDELTTLKDDQDVKMFDGVIWANKRCQRDMQSYLCEDCLAAVIPHHWDPRCAQNNAEEYRLVFLGDPTPGNIASEYIENIKDIQIESCSNVKDMKDKDLFTKALEYNCHFSVRKEDTDDFKYKPNAKLAFASGMCANIILSRDCSNMELLDERYPYYTDSDLASVIKTAAFARSSYGTKTWNEALEMIKDARKDLSLNRISQLYLQFLGQF